jgi:hypothetical protein
MFTVLVKFAHDATPVMFGITNIMHAGKLADMRDVDWVSPVITGTGYAVDPSSPYSDRLSPISPEPPF